MLAILTRALSILANICQFCQSCCVFHYLRTYFVRFLVWFLQGWRRVVSPWPSWLGCMPGVLERGVRCNHLMRVVFKQCLGDRNSYSHKKNLWRWQVGVMKWSWSVLDHFKKFSLSQNLEYDYRFQKPINRKQSCHSGNTWYLDASWIRQILEDESWRQNKKEKNTNFETPHPRKQKN